MHNKKIDWKVLSIILTIVAIIIAIAIFLNKGTTLETANYRNITIGQIVDLKNEDKEVLREKTIEYINKNLKTPSIAEFQEKFEYICDEENIIKVKGYVDSQNSFGAMIRGNFLCEFFAVGNSFDMIVYAKYNDKVLLDIKETYIEEYKKQVNLGDIKKSNNDLNQEKLDYIKNEFNNEQWNDVGRIENVIFDISQSQIDVNIIAESSKKSEEDKMYWINYNICSILHYFKEFNVIGNVKMTLYDIEGNKVVELDFDNKFLKEIWKDNRQINLVKDLFGNKYKEF